MSSRKRPQGKYLRAARKLAEQPGANPIWQIYSESTELSPAQKSAIAREAHLPPLQSRTVQEYVEIAKRLSIYAPGLKKYKRRKKLSPQEKAAISHKLKLLRYTQNLIPISKKTAKELKGLLAPGIQAIPMLGVGENATVERVSKDMILTTNGRTYILWQLKQVTTKSMKKAAEKIFSPSFDLEALAKLAERAFQKFKVIRIQLWSEHGIVGDTFRTLNEWVQWLYESYQQYQNVERWVNGIAIRIK